jgi:DNA-binding CsgD family transcriptional regulator
MKYRHTYIVFREGVSEPLAVDATAEECAKAMNVSLETFHMFVSKQTFGLIKNWKIFKSVYGEPIEHARGPYAKCQQLAKIDYDIIKTLHEGYSLSETADEVFISYGNIFYRIRKIKHLTGLDPKNEDELKELYKTYIEKGR